MEQDKASLSSSSSSDTSGRSSDESWKEQQRKKRKIGGGKRKRAGTGAKARSPQRRRYQKEEEEMSQNDIIRSTTPPPPPSTNTAEASSAIASTQNGAAHNQQHTSQHPQPRQLEPTLNIDGSILSTPLSTVLNATTDALYNDLHTMTYGELTIARQPVTTTTNTQEGEEEEEQEVVEEKKEKMASLNFAKRRHELALRLHKHSKSLQHVSALVTSYCGSTSASSSSSARKKTRSTYSIPLPADLGDVISTSSKAFQHVKTAWTNADEAQDALYFHHAELWKARKHSHDVFAALQIILDGTYNDFPSDVCLKVDKYGDVVDEKKWGEKEEVKERLRCNVTRKLVLGEVGYYKNNSNNKLPWKITLEKNGGVVRLTHGSPSSSSTSTTTPIYPIEARVTVLNTHPSKSQWTLLSIHANIAPKTGESLHQLDLNYRQMYDLHRLCVKSMKREEMIYQNLLDKNSEGGETKTEMDGKEDGVKKIPPPRPLDCLFEVAHTFAISLQMEVLSSQAESLKKGAWGGGATSSTSSSRVGGKGGIVISPVQFYDDDIGLKDEKEEEYKVLAEMSIYFWECDDRFGSPRMGDLYSSSYSEEKGENDNLTAEQRKKLSSPKYNSNSNKETKQEKEQKRRKLCLNIRAISRIGILVSLSGGAGVMSTLQISCDNSKHHLERNVQKLLQHITNPFTLSISDALLASTVICAHQRCVQVVKALEMCKEKMTTTEENGNNKQKKGGLVLPLPKWLHLDVESGTISVAMNISYQSSSSPPIAPSKKEPVVVFRLACDSRSGKFVTVFPRSSSLLRLLACNDRQGSEMQSLRYASSVATNVMANAAAAANSAKKGLSSAANATKGKSSSGGGGSVGGASFSTKDLSGRYIRDAFEGLVRSVDVLGRRAGVGGGWVTSDTDDANDDDKNYDSLTSSLRERSILQACVDVRTSLMNCAGIAAVYGVGALALGVVTGVDAAADVAGGPIEKSTDTTSKNNTSTAQTTTSYLPIPPLSIILHQQMVEEQIKANDNVTKATTTSDNGSNNSSDDETRTISLLQREQFALSGSVTDDAMTIYCFDVVTRIKSPLSFPNRIACTKVPLLPAEKEDTVTSSAITSTDDDGATRATKRAKIDGTLLHEDHTPTPTSKEKRQIIEEVQDLAARFYRTLYR